MSILTIVLLSILALFSWITIAIMNMAMANKWIADLEHRPTFGIICLVILAPLSFTILSGIHFGILLSNIFIGGGDKE